MRILFVHQNFPGQFLHLSPALAARGHDVLALTAETNRRPSPVRVLRYRNPPAATVQGAAGTYAEMTNRGAVVARAGAQLSTAQGFAPDLVIGHGGWGETLFLREVWPAARHLTYAEFCYHARGLDADFDPEFRRDGLDARIMTAARRAHLLMALADADAAIAPTAFQAATFPAELQAKISVIHDGIDTDRLRPDPGARLSLPGGRVVGANDAVISFVARNLEPYRGYHVFMRALPAVMAARPEAEVVIVGGEGQSYGPAPGPGQSWKQRFLGEVAGRIDPARLHFIGQVPYADFIALMQVTKAHAYLSYPFVLSWSMLEAMSAGALVIGSRTPPVEEVIGDGINGRLVDFFDIAGWSRALIAALADPAAAEPLRAAARATVQERFDLTRVCLPRLLALVEAMAPG